MTTQSGNTDRTLPRARSLRQQRWSNTTFGRSHRAIRAGLGAALLVLLVLVTLPPATTAWITSLRERLSGQIQTVEDLRYQIETDVQRMQAAQRGYLLTQQPAFLDMYRTSDTQLRRDLHALQTLAPQVEPALAPQVQALVQRVEHWRANGPEYQQTLLAQGDAASAVAAVADAANQQRFDAALAQLQLIATEVLQLEDDLAARIAGVRRLETQLALGLGLLGVVLGGYLVHVFRGSARQARAIEQLYDAVAREQQRLQVIFDQSPEGILFIEASSGTVALANQAARTLLDDALAPGAPLPAALLSRMYDTTGEVMPPARFPLAQALVGEERIGVEVMVERTDTQRHPLLFNCVPLHDDSGTVRGAVAIFQDLTHFREVERLKSDFVALVSHELRTPLTAIQGCTQALLHGHTRSDAQRTHEFLEIIETQSARLHDLIDHLLDMSQVEAGTLRLRIAPVHLDRLVRTVVREANERWPDVLVQAEVPQPLPALGADAHRLEQVLLNLLENAHKFSPTGGIITVRADLSEEAIAVQVRDQGPGIPPAERARVFERFFQGTSPPRGDAQGTGLGLAICRALVEAHGGRIWVEDQVDAGTQITFTLPRTLEIASEQTEPQGARHTPRRARDAAHILVVDDEPALRQLLRRSLTSAGYVVQAVAEGQAALEHLGTEQPDLIVLDLMLPGEDGLSVLRRLRAWSSVPVLILTASPDPANVVRGLHLGADDYLTKPFSMDELLARVEAVLRRAAHPTPTAATVFAAGPLRIDFARRSVEVHGAPVALTPTEFRLLAVLAHHAGQVLTHAQLLQQAWGPEYGGENQYLWVHMGRLRQKIEADPKSPQLLVTERGVGYRLALG